MAKEKPRLHLVAGTNDPGTHCEDLEWFFQVLDSEAGNKSALGAQLAAAWNGINAAGCNSESNFYTDEQCGWPHLVQRLDGHPAGGTMLTHFRKGRIIFRALVTLTRGQRYTLADYYTPRQFRPPGAEGPSPERVREAHGAYYAAREVEHG